MNKVSKESMNLAQEKISELRRLFPEIVAEGKVDFNKLQRTLGEDIDGKEEKYSFNWAGRKESFKNIQITAKGTLIPAEKESINFDKTENLFIEGDNLEVLKLLQKSYFNKIKMIYIDPPYNTGKDFVYKDNFSDNIKAYLEQTGQSNGDGIKLTTNPETAGRFHSNWISMMYPRLFIARNLLRDDGVIFVSIDDNEVTNLRKIMDEIFGEENFISEIIWYSKYTVSNDTKYLSRQHEYVLFYAKNKESIADLRLARTKEMDERYTNPNNDVRGEWKATPLHAKSGSGESYTFTFKNGIKWKAPQGRYPRFSVETLKRLDEENRLWFGKDNKTTPSVKTYLSEMNSGRVCGNLWHYQEVGHTHQANEELAEFMGKGMFDNPKPTKLIKKMMELSTTNNSEDIILDFFSGSATTAHAVLDLNKEDGGNRKFILVQLPEKTDEKSEAYKAGYKTIAEIGKERVRRVIKLIEKEKKENSKQKKLTEEKEAPLDLGFKVFKLERSNYKIWEKYEGKDEKELKRQLALFKSPLVSGYKDIDVIYECIIKEGYGLNSKIENTDIKTNKIYKVTDGELYFYVCLDQEIKDKAIDELKLKKENMFICLDEALTDSKKKNLAIQCNLKTI